MKPLVVFDHDCTLCRMFAEFSRKRTGSEIDYIAWQKYRETDDARRFLGEAVDEEKPRMLYVIVENQVHPDEQAWEWLMDHHGDVKKLGWLAQKMGISKQTAKFVRNTGHLARKILCSRCRR